MDDNGMRALRSATQQFWKQVNGYESPGGCWEWQGRIEKGLPIFRYYYEGKDYKTTASRAAWQFLRGRIEGNTHVHRTCHSNTCVNPAHGNLGTKRMSVSDTAKTARGWQHSGLRPCYSGGWTHWNPDFVKQLPQMTPVSTEQPIAKRDTMKVWIKRLTFGLFG